MKEIDTRKSAVMSTKEIAKLTGKSHSHVLRDTRNMLSELQDPNLHPEEYQVVTAANGMTAEVFLNQDLSLLLTSGYSLALRYKIIKRWRELEDKELKALRNKKVLRDATAVGYSWMQKGLLEQRTALGKETKQHHYINEARLINGVLTGSFKKADRDLMSATDLETIAELQRINSVLIAQNVPYQERKAILLNRHAVTYAVEATE